MARVCLKPLYISTSLKDLNIKSVYDKGERSIKTLISFATKAYNAAEEAGKVKDEERAYVLYMKYLDIIKKVKKLQEYKKDPQHYNTWIGKAKIVKALESAESLSVSLTERYAQLKEEKESKVVAQDEPETQNLTNGVIPVDDFEFPQEKLDRQLLYEILYKKTKSVIVMDLRSTEDYLASHLTHESCISVPRDFVTPGCTPSKVEKGIASDHLPLWNSRDNCELIILLDWNSSYSRFSDLSDPLRSLHDCIWKWDQDKTLRRKPVILEGGYVDWLEVYPQFTTNPRAKPPSFKPVTGNLNSLLEFSYDDLKSTLRGPEKSVMSTEKKPVTDSPPLKISQGANSVGSTPLNLDKNNSTSRRKIENQTTLPEVPVHNGEVNSVYPALPTAQTAPKPDRVPVAANAVSSTVKKNPQPTFDRSVKPTLTNTNATKRVETPSVPKVGISDLNNGALNSNGSHPITKPPGNAGTAVNMSNPFSDFEKRLAQKEQEQKEKEKEVSRLLDQRKLAELKAKEAQMKKKDKELEIQKRNAERDLAMAMRNLPKPLSAEDKPDVPKISPHNPTNSDKSVVKQPASVPTASKKLVEPGPSINGATNLSATTQDVGKGDLNLDAATSIVAMTSLPPEAKQVAEKPIPTVSEEKSVAPKPVTSQKNTKLSGLDFRSSLQSPATTRQLQNDSALTPSLSPPQNSPAPKDLSTATYFTSKQGQKTQPIAQTPAGPSPDHVASSNDVVKPVDRSRKPVNASASDSSVSFPVATQSQTPVNKVAPNRAKWQSTKGKAQQQQGFGGLKRSSSSPNIAKMVQDEKTTVKGPIIPSRSAKPTTFSFEPSVYESQLSRSLQGVWGGPGNALCGLRNLGNTCYMNATLQCLCNTTQLATYILNHLYRVHINRDNKIGSGGKVAEGFAVLLRAVWTSQYRYLIPRDFKDIMARVRPRFSSTTQEDAQELLMGLLDELHEDLNKASNSEYEEEPVNDDLSDEDAAKLAWEFHKRKNQSIMIELFNGQYKATLTCLHCKKTSRKFETFMYLTLPLPQRSAHIEDIIRSFTKIEKMTGTDRWQCPRCKVARDATRTMQIWKLPVVLIVHFKRFVQTGRWLDKIHTDITYPISNFNLQPFTLGPQKRKPYDLYAVTHHSGPGLDSGHYTASCKSIMDERWYKYDDTEVSRTIPPRGPSSYILYYCCVPRQPPV